MFAFIRRAATLCAMALTLAPATAMAATGGVQIIVQQWTPATPDVQKNNVVFDRPGLIADAIGQGWAKARGPVCDAITAEAGKPDRIASGYTLRDIECSMALTGQITITGFADNILTLSMKLPANRFQAKSTQPTVAGKYADPCMFLYYDVTATTSIHLDSLAVDPFTATISNVTRPDSCNTAGDIEFFLAKTYHFFGGTDYLALVQNALQQTQSISAAPLNAAMQSVLDPIRTLSAQFASRTNFIRNGNVYVVFAPVYVPQPLSAGIGGSIAIRKSPGVTSVPDCATFALNGTVQTGPAPITNPVFMYVADPPMATIGSGTARGPAVDAGDRYTCPFTATGMPVGVPVAYRGSGDPWSSKKYLLAPDGWTGKAALTGVTPGKNFIALAAPTLNAAQYISTDRLSVVDNHPNQVDSSHVNAVLPQNSGSAGRSVRTGITANTLSGSAATALNPQPLPPSPSSTAMADGSRLFGRGDYAGAAAAFDRAHEADANNAAALHDLAVAHARMGRTAQAATELQQAARLAHAGGDIATANAGPGAIVGAGP